MIPVARALVRQTARPALSISLTYRERYRRRGRLRAEDGTEFLLDLAEATELPHGALLALEDGRLVQISAAPEPLARITGTSLPRLAWHVGNRHTPCQIEGDSLLIQRDHVLEAMLQCLGAKIDHLEAPFQPEGGAYGHGRTHAHAHSHKADDDPNAHIPHRHS